MRQIEALIAQLEDPRLIDSTRKAIFGLLRDSLDEHRSTLDDWQKLHFTNAVGALALNINSLRQPSQHWLRLCLSDFRLALLGLSERRSGLELSAFKHADKFLSYDELIAELDAIEPKIKSIDPMVRGA